MGIRKPLKSGAIVKMPNGGQYIVCEKIGEGGLSLIYAAKTKANGYPVIIKEFFPSEHAHRAEQTEKNSDGTIAVRKGCVCPDIGFSDRFDRCLKAFEQEGKLGSSAHGRNFQIISFSDCGNGYAVMPRWSSDSCSFLDLVAGWHDCPPITTDPVFTDLGRIRFALTAVSSLLSAVSSIHAQGMLHLDISPSNVVWSGQSHISPENGAAFLTDFGCSVLMADGAYPAEYALSYSKAYAAPEYKRKGGHLDQTTDIYSVGRVLAFLCFGQRSLYVHTNLRDLSSRVHIPNDCRQNLVSIILKATEPEMTQRYPSAVQMQTAVNQLLDSIPLHPINPDNTTAFTLYSLKSMLEGSLDTRYSWAHELRDRRGISLSIPESVHNPVAHIPGGHFTDNVAFLQAILPEELFNYLMEQVSDKSEKKEIIDRIMAGNYSGDWKTELAKKLSNYGLSRLLTKCRTLLYSEQAFITDINLLFQVPGSDITYFEYCYTECSYVMRNAPHKGLALLVIFALLGQGEKGFEGFYNHSPSEICKLLNT